MIYNICFRKYIRNRPFMEFSGPYQMCFKFSSNCSDMCCFAHNREEMYMWNTEKYTPFDIQTFCAVNNFKRASIPHLQQVPRPLKGKHASAVMGIIKWFLRRLPWIYHPFQFYLSNPLFILKAFLIPIQDRSGKA